jgi:hypothetical protein
MSEARKPTLLDARTLYVSGSGRLYSALWSAPVEAALTPVRIMSWDDGTVTVEVGYGEE